jgi:signal transduction histidine kinase
VVELHASKLFAHLPPEELQNLQRLAIEQRFPADTEIFKEGDGGDGVYVVKDGLVEISGFVGSQARHIFSRITPGEVFGEMAVVDHKPRSACAVARAPTTLYFVPCVEMEALMERSPGLALRMLREVTQRLREFNRQYVRELLQAERLAIIGRFARSIVHDLKNPLNIISLSAEMAELDQAKGRDPTAANLRIRRQVERINDLISEILEFSGGTHGERVTTPTDYAAFVAQLTDELQPEIRLKSVELELQPAAPGLQLAIDPKRLRRVFENLVHNAADAMPEGGRITCRIFSRGREVITEIEDTGPGIAAEIAGQLFEPFSTFGKAHGTGLGLSICKRIIEDHRGWIDARNQNGKGAIFSFGLPLPAPANG